MGRIVLFAAVLVGGIAAGTQAKPTDGEALGRLCLQAIGFLVTTFLLYVAFRDAPLPRFGGRYRSMVGRLARRTVG